jgi:hypothetical protein
MRRLPLILAVLVAVAAAVGGTLALEMLVDAVWPRLAVLIFAEVGLLVFAVVARPEKKLPILCDPVVVFVGFQSQFFVLGPIALPYTTFMAETPVPATMIVMTVLGFIGLLSMFLVGYYAPFSAAIADHITDFRGNHRHAPGRAARKTRGCRHAGSS